MPSVHPRNTHAHVARQCRRRPRPRAVPDRAAGQGRTVELISVLLKNRPPPDTNEARCFDLIRRFHRWGRRDSIRGLRLVTAPLGERERKSHLAGHGDPHTGRYVLELARFPSPQGHEWTLVMWGIDEQSVRFQPYRSERAARAAFRQEQQAVPTQ